MVMPAARQYSSIFSNVREKDQVRDGLNSLVRTMTDNQQLTEITYHTVEHDVIAIVCECISLLEVKVVILVFGILFFGTVHEM
jgi:hypothetical protein